MEKSKRKEAVDKVLKLRRDSISGRAEARERSKEVEKYIFHDPYTDSEKEKAREWNKPLLRYALLLNKLTTLIGNEQSNRREVKFLPMQQEDDMMIRFIEGNYHYIEESNDLQRLLVQHMADGLMYQTGGWLRREIETDDMGYLTLKYKLYDTFAIHPDKEFRRIDLSDCSYIIADDWLRLDEIRHIIKESSLSKGMNWWEEVTSGKDLLTATQSGDNEYKVGDRFMVCQMEERRKIPISVIVIEGEETPYKFTDEELTNLEKSGKKYEVLRTGLDERIYITTVVPYFEDIVVENKQNGFPTKRFSFFHSRSFDFNMPSCRIPSLCYLMVDPQDRINKFRSQEVEYAMQTLGEIWHVDAKDVDVVNALKTPSPRKILEYKNINRKASQEPGGQNAQAVNLLNNAAMTDFQFLEEVSNITAAMQGKRGNSAESGVLFETKVEQAYRATNPYYEIKAKVNELIAKDFTELFPSIYFEDFRLMTLKNESGFHNIIINQTFESDSVLELRKIIARVNLDEGEHTPNRLRDAFNENLIFVNTLIQSGQPAELIPWELIVKNSNLQDKEMWVNWFRRSREIMQERTARAEADAEMAQLATVANPPANNNT